MARCICEWPPTCGGTGVLTCDGCGGDICVCAVCYGHGEMDCDGCVAPDCPMVWEWEE